MRHLQQLSFKKTRAREQSLVIVVLNLLAFAISLAFVDDRFIDWLAQVEWLKIMTFRGGGRLQCQSFLFPCCCAKTPPSSFHISFPRPVVHFLPRSPDETGCEDRWGILSQSQVPDPTGVSVRIAPTHITTQPAAFPQALICCLNVFGLRFTVLRCRLISPRSM